MNVPTELKYADSHEWMRAEADGTVTIGITDHAQAALGDLVFIELPAVGRVLKAGEACAVVESVKAASDVYAPIAGEVVAVNDRGDGGAGNAERGRVRARGCSASSPPMPTRSPAMLDAAAYEKLIALNDMTMNELGAAA